MPKRVPNARRGGWQQSKYITDVERREVSDWAHSVDANVCLTIMPEAGSDAERKPWIAQIVANLGRDISRRGRRLSAVTIHEKKADVDLHAHVLARVESGDFDLLERFDGAVVRVDVFNRRWRSRVVSYCLKQRRWKGPEVEAAMRKTAHASGGPYNYQKGAPFKGRRVSWTAAAKDERRAVAARLTGTELRIGAAKKERPATAKNRRGRVDRTPAQTSAPARKTQRKSMVIHAMTRSLSTSSAISLVPTVMGRVA